MAPILHLAVCLLVAASSLGCSGRYAGAVEPAAKEPTAVTPQNQTFSLSRGQTFTIGLPSAGGGGYEWHLEETYDTRVVRLNDQRRGELPANSPLGKFADEIFDFEGLAPGQTTVVFSQYRAWEGPERAIETRRFPVTVR